MNPNTVGNFLPGKNKIRLLPVLILVAAMALAACEGTTQAVGDGASSLEAPTQPQLPVCDDMLNLPYDGGYYSLHDCSDLYDIKPDAVTEAMNQLAKKTDMGMESTYKIKVRLPWDELVEGELSGQLVSAIPTSNREITLTDIPGNLTNLPQDFAEETKQIDPDGTATWTIDRTVKGPNREYQSRDSAFSKVFAKDTTPTIQGAPNTQKVTPEQSVEAGMLTEICNGQTDANVNDMQLIELITPALNKKVAEMYAAGMTEEQARAIIQEGILPIFPSATLAFREAECNTYATQVLLEQMGLPQGMIKNDISMTTIEFIPEVFIQEQSQPEFIGLGVSQPPLIFSEN